MLYVSRFQFPDAEKEYDVLMGERRTCYDFYYPFKVLSKNQLEVLTFEPVTILYGGNGSGKSTALNVIAEKLELSRLNRADFRMYLGLKNHIQHIRG